MLWKKIELSKIDGLLGPRIKFEIINRTLNILFSVRSEESKEIREKAMQILKRETFRQREWPVQIPRDRQAFAMFEVKRPVWLEWSEREAEY